MRYVLYPISIIEKAIKSIPNYNNYKYKGKDSDFDYSDCDDRAHWNMTFLRLMLPGCSCFYVVGCIFDGPAHAFVGVCAWDRSIIWVEGSPRMGKLLKYSIKCWR
jgi:hypothetical protein